MSLLAPGNLIARICERDTRRGRANWFDASWEHRTPEPGQPADLLPLARRVHVGASRAHDDALSHWRQYGYQLYGPLLREGARPPAESKYDRWTEDELLRRVELIDEMCIPLPHDLILWRGCEWHESLRAGERQEKGFVSATWNEAIGEQFARMREGVDLPRSRRKADLAKAAPWRNSSPTLLRIAVPAGALAAPLGLLPHATSPGEGEILLARDLTFERCGPIRRSRGMRVLNVRVRL